MTDKKRRSPARFIWNILVLIPQMFGLLDRVFHKLKAEAYFTVKNMIVLVVLGVMLACLLTATWISLLAALFFALLQWQWSWYAAALIILLLNVICLIIIGIFMAKIKNKLLRHL